MRMNTRPRDRMDGHVLTVPPTASSNQETSQARGYLASKAWVLDPEACSPVSITCAGTRGGLRCVSHSNRHV